MPRCRWMRLWLVMAGCLLAGRGHGAVLPKSVEVYVTGEAVADYPVARAVDVRLGELLARDGLRHRLVDLRYRETGEVTSLVQLTAGRPAVPAQVGVRVTHVPVPAAPTTRLLVSNTPERLPGPRILLEHPLRAADAARLLYHHLNDTPAPLIVSVELLNPSGAAVQVQVIDAQAGPDPLETLVGYLAALRYAERERRNAGFLVTVPANTQLCVVSVRCPPRGIVSGLARFRLLTPDGQLILRVRAHAPADTYVSAPMRRYTPSSVLGDFAYPSAGLAFRGTYLVGGGWLFLSLGDAAIPAERPGQQLEGAYGAWHTFTMTAVNPTPRAVQVELTVLASGGPGRLVYTLGDRWHGTGMLHPSAEKVLTSFTLAPNARRTLTLTAMPQSGSNYPMRFCLREWFR